MPKQYVRNTALIPVVANVGRGFGRRYSNNHIIVPVIVEITSAAHNVIVSHPVHLVSTQQGTGLAQDNVLEFRGAKHDPSAFAPLVATTRGADDNVRIVIAVDIASRVNCLAQVQNLLTGVHIPDPKPSCAAKVKRVNADVREVAGAKEHINRLGCVITHQDVGVSIVVHIARAAQRSGKRTVSGVIGRARDSETQRRREFPQGNRLTKGNGGAEDNKGGRPPAIAVVLTSDDNITKAVVVHVS